MKRERTKMPFAEQWHQQDWWPLARPSCSSALLALCLCWRGRGSGSLESGEQGLTSPSPLTTHFLPLLSSTTTCLHTSLSPSYPITPLSPCLLPIISPPLLTPCPSHLPSPFASNPSYPYHPILTVTLYPYLTSPLTPHTHIPRSLVPHPPQGADCTQVLGWCVSYIWTD